MISFRLRAVKGKNANGREHHMAKARRVKQERAHVHGALLVQVGPDYAARLRALLPARVTFRRFGVRLVDSDNLQSYAAAVRDEIAAILGVTDGPTDERVEWVYEQVKGAPGLGVIVEQRTRAQGAA